MNAKQRSQARRVVESQREEILAVERASHQQVITAHIHSLAESKERYAHVIEALVNPLKRRLGAKEDGSISLDELTEAIFKRMNRLDFLEAESERRTTLIERLDQEVTALADKLRAVDEELLEERKKDSNAKSLRRRLQEKAAELERMRVELAKATQDQREHTTLLLPGLPVFRAPRGR